MKDYSLSKDYQKNFILGYDIIDNFIIITRANNGIDILPYSLENEKNLLKKMKEQVLKSKVFSKNINNKFEIFAKLFMDEILLLVMFLVMKFSLGITLVPTIMGIVIFPVIIGLTLSKLVKYQGLRNDIKKHLLFLNNEECLNVVIRNNSKVRNNMEAKLRDKICSNNKGMIFSLNSINDIRYRELKKIYKQTEEVVKGKKCRVRRKNNREKRF